jgi:hypothetical protein
MLHWMGFNTVQLTALLALGVGGVEPVFLGIMSMNK